MENSAIFWWTTLWMLFWGVVGSAVTRRVYLHKDLDTSNSVLVGSLVGAAFGPFGLIPLWKKSPEISRNLILYPSLLAVAILMAAFALADPENNCVSGCIQNWRTYLR